MNTFWDDIKAILGRPVVKLIILVVLSLIICGIYAAEKETGAIHTIQNSFKIVTSPLQQLGIASKYWMGVLSDKIYENFDDSDSVSQLKTENSKLKSQIIANEKYKQEAERLQKLLSLKDQYSADGIGAYVIGYSGNAWNQTITIGVGLKDGVNAGQTVYGINGIIGQIDSVEYNISRVRLLNDPNSGVAVRIMNTNSDCILKGSLEGVMYIEGLDVNENINIGDVVVTSGLGGSFVSGLPVGSISQIISSDSGINRKIVVNSIEKLSSVSEVFVIKEIV